MKKNLGPASDTYKVRQNLGVKKKVAGTWWVASGCGHVPEKDSIDHDKVAN